MPCTLNTNTHRMFIHKCVPGKTCANKDGSNSRVTCGPGFLAKPGSTRCTNCANDGTECCTRMLFFVLVFQRSYFAFHLYTSSLCFYFLFLCYLIVSLVACTPPGSQDMHQQRRIQFTSHVRVRVLDKTWVHALHALQKRRGRVLHSYVTYFRLFVFVRLTLL